jgi:hypothetical protein
MRLNWELAADNLRITMLDQIVRFRKHPVTPCDVSLLLLSP